ncbi:MAG: saccharopine dehydrogenase NADP-binding domain-containing protein [Pseudomonadota bacterium]
MKKYQLTLLGGTGVTGRNTFRHLAATLAPGTPWAIAGRNSARLQALSSELENPESTPDLVIADLNDPATLEALIRDTEVLLHLAGPYAESSEPIFEFCLKYKTHYADIGGETFFIKDMIAKYHKAARARGVIFLPTAGYESVPFDLLTKMTIEHVRTKFDEGCREAKIVAAFHQLSEKRDRRISGGSIGTIKNILHGDHVGAFNDMACLLPPSPDSRRTGKRNRVLYKARFDEDVQNYVGPLQPAPFLNVPVVLRSAHLLREQGLDYGDDFIYRDSMTMEFYASSPTGQRRAARKSARLNGLLSLAMRGPKIARKLFLRRLDAMGIQPGDGPREDTLDQVDYELRMFATSDTGIRLQTSLSAKGHPGYLSTSKIIAEVGIYLSELKAPKPHLCGVVTPASVLGNDFLPRLERAQVTFSIGGQRSDS